MGEMMSELEAILAFPTHIYTVEKPEFVEKVRERGLRSLAGQKPDNDIYPVVMSGPLEAEPRIQDFCAYVAITAGNILTDQGYKTDGMGAYFQSLWLQEHHKHSGMDQHTHPGALMVGFYFLDVPEGSPAATFFDPRAGKVATGPDEANAQNMVARRKLKW